MGNGDTLELSSGVYMCGAPSWVDHCASPHPMLATEDLSGTVKCADDRATCLLDAEGVAVANDNGEGRRVFYVEGTRFLSPELRSLLIRNGLQNIVVGCYLGQHSRYPCVHLRTVRLTAFSEGGRFTSLLRASLNSMETVSSEIKLHRVGGGIFT